MKTHTLSRRNVPVSIIGFLLLATTMTIGCAILSNAYPVMSLHPVLLTQDDLPTMQLMKSKRNNSPTRELSRIVEFEQLWSEELVILYFLFNSTSAAQKAASPLFPDVEGYRPEPNPKEVIGDATWRVEKPLGIYFVKHNVLVYVLVKGHPSHRLPFARNVARKIETKITAVLEKK